ncbi:hypothetical protein QUF51_01640 [Bacillus pumilus]|nr:hypothetical protein [Bacillus pumilus]
MKYLRFMVPLALIVLMFICIEVIEKWVTYQSVGAVEVNTTAFLGLKYV